MGKVVELYDPWLVGLDVSGKSRSEYICRCPFHDDKKPTGACFSPTSGLFYCFVCSAKSNAVKLASLLGGSATKVPVISKDHTVEEVEWSGILKAPLALDNPYLQKRQVTNEQIKRFGIRAMPKGVAIPVCDTFGKEVGCVIRQYKGFLPRYLYLGDKPPLWNLQNLMQRESHTRVWVVEGIFGVLRADLAGVFAVATMTATLQERGRDYLGSFFPYVLFDNDYAGYLGAAKLLQSLPLAKVEIPGEEADEMSVEEWRLMDREPHITNKIMEVANASGNKEDIIKQITKGYNRKWKAKV